MNFNEMVCNLFEALDDNTRYIYGLYKDGRGEYPSELAIKTLQAYQDKGFGTSKALEEMGANLAEDIQR